MGTGARGALEIIDLDDGLAVVGSSPTQVSLSLHALSVGIPNVPQVQSCDLTSQLSMGGLVHGHGHRRGRLGPHGTPAMKLAPEAVRSTCIWSNLLLCFESKVR